MAERACTCQSCGVSFTSGVRGRTPIYCSKACYPKPALRRSVCRKCDKEFEHRAQRAVLCPNCRYLARTVPESGRTLVLVDGQNGLLCTKCGTGKSLDQFRPDKKYKHGRFSWCRACVHEYNVDHKDRTLELSRKSRFGISIEDQRAMWKRQQGRCGSCGHPFANLGEAHLDHDHATGRVRAYLCPPCNHIIGRCREDPDHLAHAIRYLLRQRELALVS